MYETIEAIYDEGKIFPLYEKIEVKRAKVFITIVENMEAEEPQGVPLKNLMQCKGVFRKFPEGIEYQKELRDEW
ncbi:MAG: hypothetical protein KAW12_07670 [Candidatus Aminicenantes bacterium]|nr:hypothetical protein [Candidatus Aminicenantes bacterium]